MGKSKAERILDRQRQQPLDEHELDLFLGAAPRVAAPLESSDLLPAKPALDLSTEPTLLPGMVLLRGFLQPTEQQALVDDARGLGLGPGGFYKPVYASGAKCRLHQMCLGRHWNVVTEQYEAQRSNHDGAQSPPLPAHWTAIAQRSLHAAAAIDPRVMGDCRAVTPDICVVNYYKKAGRNGMHIDKDESQEAMESGSPVISFSIGSAAEFAFIDHYPAPREAVPVVRLESGDVLVFGGPSRSVVHALTRVFPNTQPEWLHMRAGRLNLTFREFQPSKFKIMHADDDDQ